MQQFRPLLLLMVFAVLALGFQACKDDVPGCTDPASTNFDPAATEDDSSCHYLASDYLGVFTAYDTTSYVDPGNGQTVTFTEINGFTGSMLSYNKVRFVNFAGGCTVDATVTATTLTLDDGITQCNISPFTCTKIPNGISYTYNQGNGVTETITGKAYNQ